MITIYKYLDYRKYLKEYYEKRKTIEPSFTHRYIAKNMQFDSGYFSKIIKEERHISLKLTELFTKFLELDNKESEYFKTMVLFAKAKKHDDKNKHFETLITFNNSQKHLLSSDQFELFDNWYNLVVRELLSFYTFTGDYGELAKMISPAIKISEAKSAIRILERLKLIKKNSSGCYKKVSPVWTTGDEVKSVAIINLQKAMMELAKNCYDRYSNKYRTISTLTVSVSKDEYVEIEKEITILREKILKLARHCDDPDRVYQCNFAIFPVSNLPRKAGE